ncbi:MAG: HEPN-associated N-terminal domain-containing protein [Bryobacteraceae bacterium]
MEQVVSISASQQDSSAKRVCTVCIRDSALSRLITESEEQQQCAYCDRRGPSLSIAALAEHIRERICDEYSDVDSEFVSYDNEEGKYVSDTWSTHDLVSDNLDASEAIIDDLVEELFDCTWCRKDFGTARKLDQILLSSWGDLVEHVKYERRYFAGGHDRLEAGDAGLGRGEGPVCYEVSYSNSEGFAPLRLLECVGEIALAADLIQVIEPGTDLYRARVESSEQVLATVEDLGPPTPEKAGANRMSPVGVVMFYGALDRDTAIVETFEPAREGSRDKVVSVAKFRSVRELKVLNLTDLPQPSFFDSHDFYHVVNFLREFVRELAKPISRDGSEHVEYVPSQFVTEYFRHKFRMNDERLDGIVYRSSKNGKSACVLFFDRSDCGSDDEVPTASARPRALLLVPSATERIPGTRLISNDR